jgi:GPI mannosyltransferase 1 subunit M
MVCPNLDVRHIQQSVYITGKCLSTLHGFALIIIYSRTQYFLWYLVFLPLLIPRLDLSGRQALIYASVWVGVQALWLSEAYKLEFLGDNVFFGLWIRSLIYVVGNCWVLSRLMASFIS